MRTLLRFAWRELVRAKARAALIALILTVQATALGGGYLAEASLYRTRDTWSERLHLADLDVRFGAASAEEMPSLDVLERIVGVAAVRRRFLALGYVEKLDHAPLPVLVEYLDPSRRPAVNDLALMAGGWLEPGAPERVIADRSFADEHALAIGDEIVLDPRRFAAHFKIGGIALSAEHLIATANPDELVPHKGSLGLIYASREALDRTFPEQLYNDLLVTFTRDADPERTREAIVAALRGRGLAIEQVVRKDEAFGHRLIEVMLSGSRSVTPVTSLLVALMAAIVAFTSMRRVVAERSREIGCLLAQGFSPAMLAACIAVVGVVPGVVAAVLGLPAAMLFAKELTSRVAAVSGLPSPIMAWEPRWLALAAASTLIVAAVSAIPAANTVARMRPVHALREQEVVFCGLPPLLERLLAGRIAVRYAIRNVFRRRHLSLATATVIALSVALPASFLTSLASWDVWTAGRDRAIAWDAVTAFKVPLTDAHARELMNAAGVASWDGYVQGYATVHRPGGAAAEMRVRGMPSDGELVRRLVDAGRGFSSDEADEAIMYASFSEGRPPRLGDVIEVERTGTKHRLIVVGLVVDPTLSTILVPRRTAQRLFDLEGRVSGAYLRFGAGAAFRPTAPSAPAAPAMRKISAEILETIDVEDSAPAPRAPPGAREQDPVRTLLGDELVRSVELRSDFAKATLGFVTSLNVILLPFMALSAVLAFFFLVSVLGFLLIEREREYATLRSLGYATAEIMTVVLTEVAVLAIAGLVLSTFAWALTAHALRAPMDDTWFPIPLVFRLQDFGRCSLPTLLLLASASLPGIRALMRMNLSATLRGRALG